MSKISIYFNSNEALGSNVATQKKINNFPSTVEKENINHAAARMDLVRKIIDVPCMVNSWFRCKELNDAVGGSKTSDHMKGLAIDFYTRSNNKNIYEIIKTACNQGKLSYDQLIWYPTRNFIHISFKREINEERKQNLVK